jgi:hypothetical protein
VRVASSAARAAASMPARERLDVRANASRGRLRRRTMDAAGSGRRGVDASDSKPGRLAASLRRKTAPLRPATPSQAGAPATPRRPSQLDALRGAGCRSRPTCPVGLRRPGVSAAQQHQHQMASRYTTSAANTLADTSMYLGRGHILVSWETCSPRRTRHRILERGGARRRRREDVAGVTIS